MTLSVWRGGVALEVKVPGVWLAWVHSSLAVLPGFKKTTEMYDPAVSSSFFVSLHGWSVPGKFSSHLSNRLAVSAPAPVPDTLPVNTMLLT